MMKVCGRILALWVGLSALPVVLPVCGESLPENQRVVFVSSGSEGSGWTAQVVAGVREVLAKNRNTVHFSVRYLDASPSADSVPAISWQERQLQDLLFDDIACLVAFGEKAYNLLSATPQVRQNKIPVLVSGNYPFSLPEGVPFGIVPDIDFKALFRAAHALFPDTRQVYVVSDATPSGREMARIAEKQLGTFRDAARFHYRVGEAESVDGLAELLAHIPPRSLVFMTHWQQDCMGVYRDPEIYYPVFSRKSPAPMFTVSGEAMGLGMLGGEVVTGKEMGRAIGEKVEALLQAGTNASPAVDHLAPSVLFDLAEVMRWQVDRKSLPAGSRLLEEGIFYAEKRYAYPLLLVLLVIAAAVGCWLGFRYRQLLRKRHTGGRETNDEIVRLQHINEILTDILTYINEGVFVVDRELRVKNVNRFAFGRLDCIWDVTGKPLTEIFELGGSVTSGGRSIEQMFHEVMESGEKMEMPSDAVIITSQGSIRYSVGTIYPLFGVDRNIVGAVLVGRDLAREMQQKMSMDLLQYYTWVVNVERDTWEFGSEFLHTGARAELFDSSEKYLSHVHPEDRERFETTYAALAELPEEESVIPDDFRITFRIDFTGNGQYEWWESYGARRISVLPDGEKVAHLYGICVNVNNHKNIELQLEKTIGEAREADRLKTEFLAGMAHEIRTLLNSIVGFAGLLQDGHLSEGEREEYGQTIQKNNQQLLKLLGNVLMLSRLEAGMSPVHMQPCALAEWAAEVTDKMLPLLPAGVVLGRPVVPEAWVVETDRAKLTQVMEQLLENAITYTHRGKITVGVQLTPDQKWLEFSVADTGVGIPPERVPHLFDRFYKDGEAFRGAGLGLAICQATVRLLGGDIRVSSTEGEGTIVYFTIPNLQVVMEQEERQPIIQPVAPVEQPTASPVAAPPAPPVAGEKKSLLIAEDTDSNYLLLKALLKKEYNLDRAHDGEEAVEMFKEKRYDAILMDMKMPRKDGIEATIEIRKYSAIPIIAQTAYAFDSDRQRCMEAGCNDFISKPIKPEELHTILNKYI